MRSTELKIFKKLKENPATVKELSEKLDKNQGWVSETVKHLEEENLVVRDRKIKLADSYESRLLQELESKYRIEEILSGKKEDILKELLEEPATISQLEQKGFSQSTLYRYLKQLKETGVVKKTGQKYEINSPEIEKFLETRKKEKEHTANGEKITSDREKGRKTGFSAFTRYGIDYHPSKTYRYIGERDLELEDILIHALKFAESRKQTAMCGVFYLKHVSSLDNQKIWKKARKWNCVELWADLQAYLDQREVVKTHMFLPWEEFTEIAENYDVHPRGRYPEENLLKGLNELGEQLEQETVVYLLGGGNLILRDLKDSTKDIDVVVEDQETLEKLTDTLKDQGYSERNELEKVYENIKPSIVLEKQGFPRWDIFVEVVAGKLHLTETMKQRADRKLEFGNLELKLLSLTDIFIFKAITSREGDLEDNTLIAQQSEINWEKILREIKKQEEKTGQYFSFSVLDTLEILKQRHSIETPIHNKLVSHCLEKAILTSLEEPKNIEQLREKFEFPDYKIYNKLRELEDENKIEVDRSDKLNRYVRTNSA